MQTPKRRLSKDKRPRTRSIPSPMPETRPPSRNRHAIEDSFPIVEINRLAVPERNAFKPIYQMHKWFARRASCVFRAILLGCLKPLPVDENGNPTKTGALTIMEEFYKDHTGDPDTRGKVILDPFMGGGTTVVEALRLGCRVIGIDLNPVAWFIVKTEVEPVDLKALDAAFQRLGDRRVQWSGLSVRETLVSQYRTECPCCKSGPDEADIIYTFWVKSAICTACGKQVPLFKDFVIAQKSPSIRYYRDARCPRCTKTFDWETEPAALVADPALHAQSATYSAGVGRSTTRWAFSEGQSVGCPWCHEEVSARPAKAKRERKKVPLSVLLCPHCEGVWQWRGDLPDSVFCPACRKEYSPSAGHVPAKGKFLCTCGHTDDIIRSIRRLPEDQLLPIHPYAIEGYCSRCAGDGPGLGAPDSGDLFRRSDQGSPAGRRPGHLCALTKNGGKFFMRVTPAVLRRIEEACQTWEREKLRLTYPKQAIPVGEKTKSGLRAHHYRYWHQMFHPRQLLCLATLLSGIEQEEDGTLQEMLLSTFQALLERNNLFCRYFNERDTVQGSFARHDFQAKNTPAESNLWGVRDWRGTMINLQSRTMEGKRYAANPYDLRLRGGESERVSSSESLYQGEAHLECRDASDLGSASGFDMVVTDPPYVGNVNYAELADFFYVWLRLCLQDRYAAFAPEETPKRTEIIENPTRGLTGDHFRSRLTAALAQAAARLRPGGLVVFTFHHAEGKAWEDVLTATCDSGLEILAAYPVHGEKESSSQLMDTQGISYDLIHVCKKRDPTAGPEHRSWAGIRQEIRRRAREEIVAIQAGRYGNEPLPPADVNIVLIGKCLELYSRHYGAVADHEGKPVPLHEALKQIRDIADQMTERERPLPSELEDVDPESRVYLRALCQVKEVKSDEVHKATRGILEPDDLIQAGLITRMRAKRGRSYEVKQPSERLVDLMKCFPAEVRGSAQGSLFGEDGEARGDQGTLFIDRVHLLLGLAEAGENVVPWLDRFRGESPQIRAALEYVAGRSRGLAPACGKVLRLLDVGTLFARGV